MDHGQAPDLEQRVLRICNALLAEHDVDRLVQLITNEATALCRARCGAFFHTWFDAGGHRAPRCALSGAVDGRAPAGPPPSFADEQGGAGRAGALRVDDVTSHPRPGRCLPWFAAASGAGDVVSWLAVPVIGRSGEVVGGLCFGHPEPGRFSADDEDAVVAVAAQAAVALDNAELLRRARDAEECHGRLARHAALAIDVSNALTRRESLHEMLQDCCVAVGNHLDASAFVALVDDDGALGVLARATVPPLSALPDDVLRLPVPLTQQLLRDAQPGVPLQGRTSAAAGAALSAQAAPLLDPAWAAAHDVGGVLGVPLWDRDRAVGFIGVLGRAPFSDDAVDAVVTVAGAVAIGVVKQHAVDVGLARTRQLRALSQAALAIQAASSTADTHRVLCDEARRVLGARQAVVVVPVPVGDGDGDVDNVVAASFSDDAGARQSRGEARPPPRGVLSTPLLGNDGKRIGALVVSEKEHGAFSADDVDAAQQLARLGAVALENLRLIQALERTNKELDQFAHVASHDLKAPLRGISHLTEWLETDLGPSLPAASQTTLVKLRGRVHRMEVLIEGLLHLSRAGRPTAAERVGVNELVEDIVEQLAPPPGVTVVIDAGLPVLWTERVALEQVLLHLIQNAVQYGCPDGRGRVHVGGVERAGGFECFVDDDGPGIAPEYRAKVFEIFQRLDPRGPVDGAGIGLAVVKKIVESRGGKVWLDDDGAAAGVAPSPVQTRRGATFHVRWPARGRSRGPG